MNILTTREILIRPKFWVNSCAVVHTSTSFTVEVWATVTISATSAESSSITKALIITDCGNEKNAWSSFLSLNHMHIHTHIGSGCQDHSLIEKGMFLHTENTDVVFLLQMALLEGLL